MRTAMQELLDELKEYQLEFNIPIEVIDMCESQLNVEKEQIIDAANSVYEDKTTWGERYYNKTYGE